MKKISERKGEFLIIEIYPEYKETGKKKFFSDPSPDKSSLNSTNKSHIYRNCQTNMYYSICAT